MPPMGLVSLPREILDLLLIIKLYKMCVLYIYNTHILYNFIIYIYIFKSNFLSSVTVFQYFSVLDSGLSSG